METVEYFMSKFHALEGEKVATRRKNFFLLVHQTTPILRSNVEVLNLIIENLKPATYLQKLFQVELLIYFRRKQELLNLLKVGNDVFVSKIIKQDWFFEDTFKEVDNSEIVNEILPCMSYTVRMKVLRKMSKCLGTEKFESIFDSVVKRYGIFIGSQFIAGCSPQKVKEILSVYPVKLTSSQLQILYKKDRHLIDFYFTTVNTSIHSHSYKNLLKFIFENNPSLYAYLKEKYRISVTLGRRATKKFFVLNKDSIVEKPSDFSYLNMKAVIRKLGKESVKLFINCLPQNCEVLNRGNHVIRSFPKKYHYSLYFRTFQAHYNIKFVDYPILINEELLELIPDNSERAVLAKVKVNHGCDEFIKYLTVEESIPLIKEKINLTSDISERGNLIKSLIETCHINNDLNALLSVMKYFCSRHKNDDLTVHLQFINNIENLFGFKQFSEEMWNSLNELLTIHLLKFDQSPSTYKKVQTMPLVNLNVGTTTCQKLSYLEFLFKTSKSIDELINDYLTSNSNFPRCSNYDRNFVKYFLLYAINNIAQESFEEKDITFNCRLITEISQWNYHNKDDLLSFYDFKPLDYTFHYVIKILGIKYNPRYDFSEVLKDFRSKIFTTTENSYKSEYLETYWVRFDQYGTLTDLKWFLKYDPFTVVRNFDRFFNAITNKSDRQLRLRSWYSIRKLSHLQLDEKIIQLSLAKISDDSSVEMKSKFVPFLSLLLTSESYAAFADSYKPANKRLDLKNATEVGLYNLQSAIAKNFKNIKSHEVFPSLLNYCVGDYFKYAMPSLYSILYRTPENMLSQHLNFLSKNAVSVKKHALFLTCELSTCTKVENMIRLWNKQEVLQSIRKHMFSATIKYFVKNPLDSVFEMVKLNMVINEKDEESMKNIVQYFPKMPKKYQAQYFECSWEFLEKCAIVWEKLAPLKDELLRMINIEAIGQIQLELGLKIIEQHFLSWRSLTTINAFIFDLVACRQEKSVLFEKIFAILDKHEDQVQVYKFLHNWYYKIMSTKDTNLRYMEPYVSYFEKKVSIVTHFYDFVKIYFLKEKLQATENSLVDEFVGRIVTFSQDVVSKCGVHIMTLLGREINSNLSLFATKRVTLYDYYHSMLQSNPDPFVAILILFAMQEPPHVKSRQVEIFYKILQQIKDVDDMGVQINLYSKFTSVLKSEKYLAYTAPAMDVDDN